MVWMAGPQPSVRTKKQLHAPLQSTLEMILYWCAVSSLSKKKLKYIPIDVRTYPC